MGFVEVSAIADHGLVTFDGRTLTIDTEAGFAGGNTVQRVAVDQIIGVEFKSAGGFASGRISFAVPGAGSKAQLSALGPIIGGVSVRSSYTVTFPRSSQRDMEALRDAVQAAIEAPLNAPADDLLRKLAALHEAGVFTDDEYNMLNRALA